MTLWILEPHDPIIVRDGKPFGATPGAKASSLPFPFPSTIAGNVRSRAGQDEHGRFTVPNSELAKLKQLEVKGPFLVELEGEGGQLKISKWLFPAPLDALIFEPEKKPEEETRIEDTKKQDEETRADEKKLGVLKKLVPVGLPPEAATDYNQTQYLVGLPEPDNRKPHKSPPGYWYADKFMEWLLNSETEPTKYKEPINLKEWGHNGPTREQRTHVSIDSDKGIAREGMLFQTLGLEFIHQGKDDKGQDTYIRLGMAVEVDSRDYSHIHKHCYMKEGTTGFGGERRIVSWHPSQPEKTFPENTFFKNPDDIIKALQENYKDGHTHCRVVLLTPAYFKQGFYPEWLLKKRYDVQPTLQAIAVQRPQVVSGWDMAANKGKGGPKPTKRLAPAGTVLFLKLEGSVGNIAAWVTNTWMNSVSDETEDEQERRDGFGIAVVGAWSGKVPTITVEQTEGQGQ